MKRLVALVLAMVFVLALVVPAGAVSAGSGDEAGKAAKSKANSVQDRVYWDEEGFSGNTFAHENQGVGNQYGWQHQFTVNESVYKFGDVPPVIKDGRILVPVRAVTTALGAESIAYDSETKTVTLVIDGKTIEVQIGADCLYIDGEELSLDVPAQTINSRLVLPLRFVAEALGYDVNWDATLGASLNKNDKADDAGDDNDDADENDKDEDDPEDDDGDDE